MLTDQEKEQLNSYHKTVYDTLSPYLNEDEKAWLKDATASI
jgi:Xaa-Pro aminopeptidase